MNDEIEDLSEVILRLREQLTEASQKRAADSIAFNVGSVEVTLGLELRREGGAEGGLKLGVVSLGANVGIGRTTNHQIRLALTPETAEGKAVKIKTEVYGIPPE